MTENNIFVIIPAYNEEKNITEAVKKTKLFGYQIVVVDDGSSDQTSFLAEKEGAVVLKHLLNRGQGAALETGNQYALKRQARIIVHFDADNQFLAEEIKDIIRPIEDGEAEVVFGSRFLTKTSKIPWSKRKIIFPLARLVNKIFFGISLTDPQSGFRALSRAALEKVKIENERMAHCSEIIFKTFKNNLKIREVPITVIYRDFGQDLKDGLKIIKDLFLAKLIN